MCGQLAKKKTISGQIYKPIHSNFVVIPEFISIYEAYANPLISHKHQFVLELLQWIHLGKLDIGKRHISAKWGTVALENDPTSTDFASLAQTTTNKFPRRVLRLVQSPITRKSENDESKIP